MLCLGIHNYPHCYFCLLRDVPIAIYIPRTVHKITQANDQQAQNTSRLNKVFCKTGKSYIFMKKKMMHCVNRNL